MTAAAAAAALLAALALLAAASSACELELGAEYPDEAAERAAVDAIRGVIGAAQQEQHADGGEAWRLSHAKGLGCVRGTFAVADDVPASLRHGVFSEPGRKFRMAGRFSSARETINPDTSPDSRGFAVQVTGVDGPRAMPGDASRTVNFLAAAYPTFLFSRAADVASQMVAFAKTGVKGAAAKAAWLARHPRTALAITKTVLYARDIYSPLGATYWSKVPYRLGPHAVKYKFEPCLGQAVPDVGRSGPDFMRRALNEMLNAQGRAACFAVSVQLQEDACEQPVEDAMVEWTTPWRRVATVTLDPHQDIDSDVARASCENSEFHAWHTLESQRPLGISRIRRDVYKFSSDNRHSLNGAGVFQW